MHDRAKVVPFASGDVLELGCGAPNLDYYNRNNVRSLSGIDPSAELLARAKLALESKGMFSKIA
jgi:SAM-dependent methyltransferase